MNDFISEKLKMIQERRTNLIAELNALAGAEQAFTEMRAELEKGENDEPDKSENG
ncbi:MAG: hypothetical protein IJU45_02305 [Clostridia bacterium]|nr:hypothetical protein [Clostridia bacterium]